MLMAMTAIAASFSVAASEPRTSQAGSFGSP
jgi:hypothetical protein